MLDRKPTQEYMREANDIIREGSIIGYKQAENALEKIRFVIRDRYERLMAIDRSLAVDYTKYLNHLEYWAGNFHEYAKEWET